jgi:tRNA G18 (ribose-2'-O)-methylase SpoU
VGSAADPRLEPYLDLKDSALRSGGRWFIVEGLTALGAVLASGWEIESALVLERKLSAVASLGPPPGIPVYVASEEIMAATAGFQVHRGVLAAARRPRARDLHEILSASSNGGPVVVAEDLNDQENLGSLFRNSAALGARAVVLSPACADPLHRRTVRVSLGLVARVPFCRAQLWPGALDDVAAQGYHLVALTPAVSAEPIGTVGAQLAGQRVALVVGAEGPGLSMGALQRCRPARIPMSPGVDSLNVAAATAVALYCFTQGPGLLRAEERER